MKKLLVVGVIVLFLGLAIAPSINAIVDGSKPKLFSRNADCKTVKLAVYEYKADGTIEKNIVRLSYEKLNELKEEIQTVENIEERLSILKEYNLLPQDVTLEKLRAGMERKAQRVGLTDERLEGIVNRLSLRNNNRVFYMNRKCDIFSFVVGGIKLNFGLSFITSVINAFMFYKDPLYLSYLIPSIDFLKMFFVRIGFDLWVTNGLLPDIELGGEGGEHDPIMLMLGFVGYHISVLPTFFLEVVGILFGYTNYLGVSYKERHQII